MKKKKRKKWNWCTYDEKQTGDGVLCIYTVYIKRGISWNISLVTAFCSVPIESKKNYEGIRNFEVQQYAYNSTCSSLAEVQKIVSMCKSETRKKKQKKQKKKERNQQSKVARLGLNEIFWGDLNVITIRGVGGRKREKENGVQGREIGGTSWNKKKKGHELQSV